MCPSALYTRYVAPKLTRHMIFEFTFYRVCHYSSSIKHLTWFSTIWLLTECRSLGIHQWGENLLVWKILWAASVWQLSPCESTHWASHAILCPVFRCAVHLQKPIQSSRSRWNSKQDRLGLNCPRLLLLHMVNCIFW